MDTIKVTVSELPDGLEFRDVWPKLVDHVEKERSEIALLPEMPAYFWFPAIPEFDASVWREALKAHDEFMELLKELDATVISTRPVQENNLRLNQAFCWRKQYEPLRSKYYFPDERGFYEARWFHRKEKDFKTFRIGEVVAGVLICSEVMFNEWARWYGKHGAHIIFVPRATGSNIDRWLVALRMAAIVSGSFVLSSNRRGGEVGFGGCGFVISPEGDVIARTSQNPQNSQNGPFVTVEIDISESIEAKRTYPRYIPE